MTLLVLPTLQLAIVLAEAVGRVGDDKVYAVGRQLVHDLQVVAQYQAAFLDGVQYLHIFTRLVIRFTTL